MTEAAVRSDRAATYSQAPLAPEVGVLALELQASLATAGTVRAVGDLTQSRF